LVRSASAPPPKVVFALIAIEPVLSMLPLSVRLPPLAGSVMILPLLVNVPEDTFSVSLLPQLSPLVSVIVPALVKLADAVVVAFSEHVLWIVSVCSAARLPLRVLAPRTEIALLPAPV
jgi:hypothetical protein